MRSAREPALDFHIAAFKSACNACAVRMDAQSVLLISGAVVGAAGVAVLGAAMLRPRKAREDAVTAFEVVSEGATSVPVHDFDSHPFTVASPPAPRHEAELVVVAPGAGLNPFHPQRAPMPLPPILRDRRSEMPPPPVPIPTEWARRQVGPAEPGRTKGACSGCGAMLSVSATRPMRIACPVCGRTRLLA